MEIILKSHQVFPILEIENIMLEKSLNLKELGIWINE